MSPMSSPLMSGGKKIMSPMMSGGKKIMSSPMMSGGKKIMSPIGSTLVNGEKKRGTMTPHTTTIDEWNIKEKNVKRVMTPLRYIPRMEDKTVEVLKINPVANATIFIDKSIRAHNYVPEKMRYLSNTIRELQRTIRTNYIKLPKIEKSKITKKRYEELLNIYETNQLYYQEEIDEHGATEEIIEGLNMLEEWFIGIDEPTGRVGKIEREEINERNRYKNYHNVSFYCDTELYKYMKKYRK